MLLQQRIFNFHIKSFLNFLILLFMFLAMAMVVRGRSDTDELSLPA